ncbi:hypothetical protein HZS_4985 [Henneguya salminicola]|nr:hypothetical protein HZS_4985 [Henneguya salminicola]
MKDMTNNNEQPINLIPEMETLNIVNLSKLEKDNKKPPFSNIFLIYLCMKTKKDKLVTVSDIYNFYSANFNYFKPKDSRWKNTIRHTLSCNDCFVKVPTFENNRKGNFWTLHYNSEHMFANGCYLRRKSRNVNTEDRSQLYFQNQNRMNDIFLNSNYDNNMQNQLFLKDKNAIYDQNIPYYNIALNPIFNTNTPPNYSIFSPYDLFYSPNKSNENQICITITNRKGMNFI